MPRFHYAILLLAFLLIGILPAQSAQVPFGTDHILVFVEPFRDMGPDTTQTWLSEGLAAFLAEPLQAERKIDVYGIPLHEESLYEQPHRLQEQIWQEVFGREVDSRYDTYLVRGHYSYVDEHVAFTVELYFLKSMHLADRLQLRDRYAQMKNWKVLMGDWLLQRLKTQRSVHTEVLAAQEFFPRQDQHPSDEGLKAKLGSILERQSRQSSTELYSEYQRQSKAELGSQLERLWHDVAFDPYQAEIHDIHAQRYQHSPDSVLVTFKVTYRINPRILDEIRHFSKTRAAEIEKATEYKGHTFMDLGYTDQAFVDELTSGEWRLTPIISIGPPNYPQRRIFYHSDPMPIDPPTMWHTNVGGFRQLIMGLPGVNALRIYTMEEESTYTYQTQVGYDEMPILDKISVRFVLEKDLHRTL